MNYLPYFQWGKDFADTLPLDSLSDILDIGCRRGLISAHLARKYPKQKFVAFDNEMNEIAHANDIHLPNLNFDIADALQLDYQNHFDAVVSFHCLLWIQDKQRVLRNIYRALKPGKKAYLQFFILHGRLKNDQFLYQTSAQSKWKSYFKKFSPTYFETTFSEFSGLLQSTGFLIHKMGIVRHQTLFSHSEELHQWMKSWASHQDRIPLRKRDHFLQEATEAYLSFHHFNYDESFPYYEYFLEVECEKPEDLLISHQQNLFQYKNVIFTRNEAKVVKFFLQGKSIKEIAQTISVSNKTVEFHLGNVREKLGLRLRSELYQAAMEYGFIHLLFNFDL
jgi:SAM-dependent methyltransferase